MSTIKELEENSFNWIVVALSAVGRIFESTTDEGFRVVKFKSDDRKNNVILCPQGNLCDDPDCKFHHLHYDISKISENYVLCPHNTECKISECKYRHTNDMHDLLNRLDKRFSNDPDEYRKYIDIMITTIILEQMNYKKRESQ